MRSSLAPIVLSLALAAGCARTAGRGSVAVTAPPPDLVAAGSGVQVIADYDEPIFFADGFYWWFFDGAWYRSASYTSGWAYIATPPAVIVQIRAPHRFRFYRPPGYVARHRPMPVYHVQRPARDHRSASRASIHSR
jgi:hypothetical protein